jgi:ABC-type nitrate/sulfonate/bicarbonate transport system substrate-binding protein
MDKRQHTRLFKRPLRLLIGGTLGLLVATGSAMGGTSVKIGRTTAPHISHLPLYVAMETGLFAQEGLDATFVLMTGKALTTAGLAGRIDFIPLPGAGAEAALRGAGIRFVVGQSTFTPTALVVPNHITSVTQLQNKRLGLGQVGQSGYENGESILRDRFDFMAGTDYEPVSIPGEEDRFIALENGDIDAGLLSLIYAAKAEAQGFKRLFRTGVFRPRIEGAIWTRTTFVKANRDTVRRFIRAIARATDLINMDGRTTVAVIQKYLRLHKWEETKSFWLSVRDIYTADLPADLLSQLFADRQERLRQRGLWPRHRKPLSPETFVARSLLSQILSQHRYALETIDAVAPIR